MVIFSLDIVTIVFEQLISTIVSFTVHIVFYLLLYYFILLSSRLRSHIGILFNKKANLTSAIRFCRHSDG